MTNKQITAIVLSAGEGTRMGSSLAKSLHPVAGKPILARILQALKVAHLTDIRVVINKEYEQLMSPVAKAFQAQVCFQEELKGTAGAVKSVPLDQSENVLILNGDHPLLVPDDLQKMIAYFHKTAGDVCVGTFETARPGDYGRIVRQGTDITSIVEKTHLTRELADIQEVNTGIYLVKAKWLKAFLSQMKSSSSNHEYLLTDIISFSARHNKKILGFALSDYTAFGVNTQKALALATKKIFTRKLDLLMEQGVIIVDPICTYIEEDVQIRQGSVIYPGVYLKGKTSIGSFCAIETNSFITDSVIHDLTLIRSGSYLESVEVGGQSTVGPYARLRPGTKIGNKCHVGNFVEMKKTSFGDRSKAGHFSYLGDAEVGEDVNIGCGTVTCNFNLDGKKYPTKIGSQAFVGSGTQLVAPVELKEGSATGAGSVITKDVPAESLALSRVPQVHKNKS